ncbi:MAG: Ig-like domain-containing protein [Muribaculaceae bacterium]|nr:Ig-like domain-containing protein [Muribaculaceae bacterium]
MTHKLNRFCAIALLCATAAGASAVEPNGITIYLNPGHGGHDSDDRNVVIEPYEQGDPEGYWESNSNLAKALHLRDMLEAKGYKVVMSRVTNTTADDLKLSEIYTLANNSKADLFFSIHSNATGTVNRVNFPLMLYRGWDKEADNAEDRVIATILNRHLLDNGATYWTDKSMNVRGDWDFYNWGYKVGLGVLSGLKVTGMLSEGSFHDYIPETYRLMNDDFCRLEAWHFRKAVDEYFEQPGETVGQIGGRINDSRLPREGQYAKHGEDRLATVQNAKVELYDKSGKLVDSYTTHPILTNGIYAFRDVQPGEYTIKVSCDTHYPAEADITVKADEITYQNFSLDKIRDTAPEVVSYSPVWAEGEEGLLCNTPIVLNFNWDMDTESVEKAFRIEPEIKGTFEWTNTNQTMTFKPSGPYAVSTIYTVTLGTEARHPDNINLHEPVSFKFFTTDRNYLDILGYYPKNGDEVHYHDARIEMRLDKTIQTSSITSQVHCYDSKGKEVAFNKRGKEASSAKSSYGWFRLPFTSDLVNGETYTLTFDGTISDRDGISIQGPVTVKFKATDARDSGGYRCDDYIDIALDGEALHADDAASMSAAAVNLTYDSKTPLYSDRLCPEFGYKFENTEGGEAVWHRTVPENEPLLSPKYCYVGLEVFGDLSGNELYLEYTGNTVNNLEVCKLDFLGWKTISLFPEKLESEARLTGVRIAQVAGLGSDAGTVKIQNLRYKHTASVEDIAADEDNSGVIVNARPGADFVSANAPFTIVSVEILDLKGATVAAAGGNVVRVSGLESGVYLCRVNAAGNTVIRKIIL